jgi:thymidylate synthase
MANQKHPEYQYLNLLEDIRENGVMKGDHNTGNGLQSVFGRQMRFDLSKGFPLLTTKKTWWHGILHELYWFVSGQTNIKYLVDNGVHIWDDYPYKIYMDAVEEGKAEEMSKKEFIAKIEEDEGFAEEWGELPHIYGEHWREWQDSNGREIDQLQWVIDTLGATPERKHMVVTTWNPEYMYAMAKPGNALRFPLCHIMYHVQTAGDKLNLQLYQRSADMFLGVPFNIASYALLTKLIAHISDFEAGDFVHTLGDAHVYQDHFDQVEEQVFREPKKLPTVEIDDSVKSLDDFKPEKVTLHNYSPQDKLTGDLTVAGGFDEDDRDKFENN